MIKVHWGKHLLRPVLMVQVRDDGNDQDWGLQMKASGQVWARNWHRG